MHEKTEVQVSQSEVLLGSSQLDSDVMLGSLSDATAGTVMGRPEPDAVQIQSDTDVALDSLPLQNPDYTDHMPEILTDENSPHIDASMLGSVPDTDVVLGEHQDTDTL